MSKFLIRKYFPLGQNRLSGTTPPHFNIAFRGKCDSTYVTSTNNAGLATTYDVTSRDDCIVEHNTSSETVMIAFSTDDTELFVANLN